MPGQLADFSGWVAGAYRLASPAIVVGGDACVVSQSLWRF